MHTRSTPRFLDTAALSSPPMEWPVLGRSRTQPGKRSSSSTIEDEPQSKRRQVQPRHWNMKLATVFKAKAVPEVLQKMIEEFAIKKQFQLFVKKYGTQRAQYGGRGFVSGWHPRIASTTRDRYIWFAFSTTMLDYYRQWPETMDMEVAKRMEGHMVLITYRITKMNPKRVVFAARHSMNVDNGPNTTGFTLSYRGVISIELFVDVPR